MTSSATSSNLPRTNEGKRICQVVKVKPEYLEEYKKVHQAVWPAILGNLKESQIVDYSIHYFEPLNLLIAHMRYIGPEDQFEKLMSSGKEREANLKWWKMTDEMQSSFVEGATGSADGPGWWYPTEEVFRFEG